MERENGFMEWVDRVRENAYVMSQRAQQIQYRGADDLGTIQIRRERNDLLIQLGETALEAELEGETLPLRRKIDEIVAQIVSLDQRDGETIDLRDSERHDYKLETSPRH